MDLPSIDELRAAKTKIVAQLKMHQNFMGAGIGERDGRLILRVNWRVLPTELPLPHRIGKVEILHFEVGAARPQD